MSLQAFHDNLVSTLQGDAALSAWLATYFPGESWTVLKGNREIEFVDSGDLPAIITELVDGDSDIEVSGEQQYLDFDLNYALAWYEASPDVAFDQRAALPEIMIKAVMGNKGLGIAGAGAHVSGFENVFSPAKPDTRVMRFTVSGQLLVSRI